MFFQPKGTLAESSLAVHMGVVYAYDPVKETELTGRKSKEDFRNMRFFEEIRGTKEGKTKLNHPN